MGLHYPPMAFTEQGVAMLLGILNSDRAIEVNIAISSESLCVECGMAAPSWCRGIKALAHPWFVAGMENLKAMALVESPAAFRARNIFVLGNFLDRA